MRQDHGHLNCLLRSPPSPATDQNIKTNKSSWRQLTDPQVALSSPGVGALYVLIFWSVTGEGGGLYSL